jgi:hypothetical protein
VKKFKPLIIISTILTITGIGLTIYEFQLVNENVTNQQQDLLAGESMTLTKNLDTAKSRDGVYLVQVSDFKEGDNIKLMVFNPSDTIMVSKSITNNPLQENFSITADGNYKIQIENQGTNEVQVLAMIGNYPQNILFLDTIGFILLIIGLAGISVGLMYFLKNRSKTSFS